MKLLSSRALITVPLLYFGFGLFLYLAQNTLIYLPDERPFGVCPAAPDETETIETDTWRGYYTPSPTDDDRIIVFYHGNAGNACDRTALLQTLQAHGHAVLLVEYPGYGGDHQRPSTGAILAVVPDIHTHITARGYTDITALGESIGSGYASYHAHQSEEEVALILIAPFARLSDRVQELVLIYPARWLLYEDLTPRAWAPHASRVTLIAAEHDEVMPQRHTDRLHDALTNTPTEYHSIPDTTHNTLYHSTHFRETLKNALVPTS